MAFVTWAIPASWQTFINDRASPNGYETLIAIEKYACHVCVCVRIFLYCICLPVCFCLSTVKPLLSTLCTLHFSAHFHFYNLIFFFSSVHCSINRHIACSALAGLMRFHCICSSPYVVCSFHTCGFEWVCATRFFLLCYCCSLVQCVLCKLHFKTWSSLHLFMNWNIDV